MKYGSIKKLDVANGTGIRTTVFVSGCTHKCKGCFNEDSQSFNYGEEWTKEIEDMFIGYAQSDKVSAVSILGGEPMQQGEAMLNLVKRLREEVNKPIWMWSGYTYEQILENPLRAEILSYVDVLIDGRFELDKRDLKLKFRGSSNQRVIDVKSSLKTGEIQLFYK